jgi:phosphoribosyl 1,2-cyclic phosphodiesterase
LPSSCPGTLRISFRISILASGSTGNATLLETERTTLLIDAGLGRREILRRFEALGRPQPERVDAILITHEHSDHSSAVAQLARHWNCPAYLTEPTHREIVKMYAEDAGKPGRKATIERVQYIQGGKKFQIGDIEVNPFDIPHDAKEPVGFTFRTNGIKVAIVTDLGYLPRHVQEHLRETDFLILESNHDLEKLKLGPYPWHIKMRIKDDLGHLSNETVSKFLADSDAFDGRARYVVLAHLSEQNNDPNIAELSAKQALESRPAEFAFRGTLHIASQHIPLGPFEL